ncbi:hypothetical protein ABNF65_14790, partial [Paenibacillus larvae]
RAMNMAPFIFWNLAFYTIIRTQLEQPDKTMTNIAASNIKVRLFFIFYPLLLNLVPVYHQKNAYSLTMYIGILQFRKVLNAPELERAARIAALIRYPNSSGWMTIL